MSEPSTPRQSKKSNDYTGQQAQKLAKEAAEAKRVRAEEISMMTAAETAEFNDSVFDATEGNGYEPVVIDEILEVGVELADESRIIRVNEDIENMTYGYGNTYNFKAGGRYKVPVAVAQRLEDKGLVWH